MNFFVGIISHNQNHYVGSFTMQKVTTLRDKTRELLNKRSIVLTTKVIADEIGVTPSWVNLFAAGKIENPSVVLIETLNVLLNNHNQEY